MARMIPSDGGYFDPSSGEKGMFEALKKLPDDYYVFHSYRLVQLIPDKGLNENEIDFLVFHPNYGCLFIECKNSKVNRDSDGNWSYVKVENGVTTYSPMKDPFDQAFTGQHNLFNKLKDTYPEYREKINKCKFMVAVWLPKYTKDEIDRASFGANVTKEIILTREALLYKTETLRQINALMERMKKVHLVCKYEEEKVIENASGYDHALSYDDAMLLFKRVLCPTFRSIINLKKDYEDTYIELLEEQYVVLDFLNHQRTAAISGASGTGKTLVAVERARRLSNMGEKVLFLCYNRNLMEYLEKSNKSELKNVDFYTLDAFGCKICKVALESLNYYDLKVYLENEILEGRFEYNHIIVDEGQDFGKKIKEEDDIKSEILELFSEYGAGLFENKNTSFFIFYDKNQLVNAKMLPVYLQNVDSKLTLYKNCRNTKNIANTANVLLGIEPVIYERSWEGELVDFSFCYNEEDAQRRVEKLIDNSIKSENSDRVIISCAESLKNSSLFNKLEVGPDGRNWMYRANGKKTRIFTCATFKGLEADEVIVTDLCNDTFSNGNCDFYVAASRAKKQLHVVINNEILNIEDVIRNRFSNSFVLPDKKKQFAIAMHGIVKGE